MQDKSKQIVWLVVLLIILVGLIAMIYVGALGMQRGIYTTKLI